MRALARFGMAQLTVAEATCTVEAADGAGSLGSGCDALVGMHALLDGGCWQCWPTSSEHDGTFSHAWWGAEGWGDEGWSEEGCGLS